MLPQLSQAEKAQAQKVYCSVAKNDHDKCMQTYFEMDPQAGINNKRTTETNNSNTFSNEVNARKTTRLTSIRNNMANMDKIWHAHESLQSQLTSLQKQKKQTESELDNLKKDIRANQRRFLDNDPQQGTPSILGLRTSDDKVLLFFWIAVLLFVNLALYVFVTVMHKSHVPILYIGVTLAVLTVAYLVLYNATRIEYKLRPTSL